MALILTFLGKGGTGRTTLAIAAAKKLAGLGSQVLLIGQDPSPAFSMLLGTPVDSSPTDIAPNLKVVNLNSTALIAQGWEDVKELESKYLRSPTLKNVYGQELGILPGMDSGLALNAIREYDKSGKYEVIIYDGDSSLTTLRMLGIPEISSWYARRFSQVLGESDVVKALSPFIQPITSTILNVSWSADDLSQGTTNDILSQGKAAIANPKRLAAYLVTTDDKVAIAQAKYIWGGAQQIGLTVKGVLLNKTQATDTLTQEFAPLGVSAIPQRTGDDWQPLLDALPDLLADTQAPLPLTIDVAARQIQIFLPGFDKKQVKLTQYGPELTIEAGDQRRNIELPPPLAGQSVKGAKFQNHYLIVSF
ncbi:Get3/ArsA fold putative tail anchor-mediating ATPase NosAFP [Aphanothece sacrum]|uniref:Anion-transporting ATPase n=1 Tax=Aphanothece sacrum FPU1 TaxID=1920663 RepID=A0A401IK70_APHSA|nr:ArsA family ATPase [Aphanothece sacrum]GBF81616.1 hypothetical protein AsFPU1_3034 [Aphanothece sacrum FPU1]GBF84126.1 hypothetical protein AsFPU3_1172 [Aphanothece sacrum FPU3]